MKVLKSGKIHQGNTFFALAGNGHSSVSLVIHLAVNGWAAVFTREALGSERVNSEQLPKKMKIPLVFYLSIWTHKRNPRNSLFLCYFEENLNYLQCMVFKNIHS